MHQDLRLSKICAVASENKTFHHHRRETIRFISTHIIFTNILFKNFISETLNWQILYVEILCLQISFSILLWSQRWHQLVDFGWVQIIGLQRISMKTYVNFCFQEFSFNSKWDMCYICFFVNVSFRLSPNNCIWMLPRGGGLCKIYGQAGVASRATKQGLPSYQEVGGQR